MLLLHPVLTVELEEVEGRNDSAGNRPHWHCFEKCLLLQCVPVHLAVDPRLSGDLREFYRWASGGELHSQFQFYHKKDCYPLAI